MTEWKEYKLKDILDKNGYIRGPFGSALKRSEMQKAGTPVYEQINAIYNHRKFRYFIGEEKLEKLKRFQVRENDLIISCSGTVGKTSIIGKNDPIGIISQALLILRPNIEIVFPLFLLYFFQSKKGFYSIVNRSSGSVQVNISKRKVIENIKIKLPPLEEQKRIAGILKSLDDKIELNNQMNKTLEEIAQTLFKHWFVDFGPVIDNALEKGNTIPDELKHIAEKRIKARKTMTEDQIEKAKEIQKLFPDEFEYHPKMGWIPKGFKEKELNDLLSVLEAGNRPRGGAQKTGVPSIGAENIIGLGKYDYSKEKFVSDKFFKKMKKGIVDSGDILLYKDGAQLGRKTMFFNGFPHKKCCINSHVFKMRTNDLTNQYYLYFYLDQNENTERIKNLNTNSAQPGINQTNLKKFKIFFPEKRQMNLYKEKIKFLIDLIFENSKENRINYKIRKELLSFLFE